MTKQSKISSIFCVILVSLNSVLPLVSYASFPRVVNFPLQQYGGGPQNWAIGQAPDGTMFFGNHYGLLSYNSAFWSLMGVPNGTTVRSLLIDVEENGKGRIYVGASGEFGYYASDSITGALRYETLLNTLAGHYDNIGEVWEVFRSERYIWFQSDTKIFHYDGERTYCMDTGHKITKSQMLNGNLYVAFEDGTMSFVGEGDPKTLRPLPGFRLPTNDRLCAILPYSHDSMLLVTRFSGLYIFNGQSATKMETDLDDIIASNQVFCATLSNNKLVLGTVKNGVVIRDMTTGANTFLNKELGLHNNTVLTATFDRQGNLWLGLDNGIDYILINSPIYRLTGNNDAFGAGYCSMVDGGTLYLGTNQGLFTTVYPTSTSNPSSVRPSTVSGQVWDIDTIGGTMFVCNDNGLYYKSVGGGGEFRKVEGLPGTVAVVALSDDPNTVLASTYDNFYEITRTGVTWGNPHPVGGYNDISGKPEADGQGNYWLRHWLKGVYRLRYNRQRKAFSEVRLYGPEKGFGSTEGLQINKIKGDVVFSTHHGDFVYDETNDSIVAFEGWLFDTLGGRLPNGKIHETEWGQVWSVSTSNVAVMDTDREEIDSLTYGSLAGKLVPGYENANFISPTAVIFSTLDGFFELNPQRAREISETSSNNVFISRVYISGDSLVYTNPLLGDESGIKLRLKHEVPSLRFEFVAPEYREPNAVIYSCILENCDNEWSAYSTSTFKDYTHLEPGHYVFRVSSINLLTGETSESSIDLTVTPPWYLTIYAKIIYLLLFIGIARIVYIYISRQAKKALEQENRNREAEIADLKSAAEREALQKNYEIERLKSEQMRHDIMHKSTELSNVTMNMVRKNEILLDISSRLSKIPSAVIDDISKKRVEKQVEGLKRLIRDNISHDDDWKNFTRNFDVVYENFIKRLLERYPDLSVSEQKICVYVRMGLSSKDMAPLLNISYRSVEMSRYRLRKKMSIPGDMSLTTYLTQFHKLAEPGVEEEGII